MLLSQFYSGHFLQNFATELVELGDFIFDDMAVANGDSYTVDLLDR